MNGDAVDENNESFFLNLSGAISATISDAQGVGSITDDDTPPAISIGDRTVTEGDTGTTDAVFTVSLGSPSGLPITVDYASADGTADSPDDFGAVSGGLTFDPGETSKTVTVAVVGDVLDEDDDETYTIELSDPGNASLGDTLGLGTIIDDDPEPALSVNDVSVTEGNAGTATASFTVTLSAVSGRASSVGYATANGSATAGADYVAKSGTLNFAAGDTSETVDVTVNADLLDELNEAFFLDLSGATNATIADDRGVGTISDDDPTPSLSIDDVTVTEGNAGTVDATLTVGLSAASGREITVDFATANNTATLADYASSDGTLTFAPGDTTKTLTVQVHGDFLDEANESFFMNLSGAVAATIADDQGVVTITDDDATPSLSIDDVTVTEAATANFNVVLSAPSGQTVTVSYASAHGTAGASDYTSVSGILSFAPGETTKPIAVATSSDALDEENETFTIGLSVPGNATIADDSALGTIADDDPLPALSVGDVTVTEGDAGTATATFTVLLSPVSGRAVSVDYATANGSATAVSDYVAKSGTLNFAAGDTSETVDVTVNADLVDELNETFFLDLLGASNATIGDDRGVGTITDDDPEPSLSVGDVTVTEGNNATFTVTLSAASGRDVSVDYATADGSAKSNPPGSEETDYEATNGSLTFLAGQTSKTVTVTVRDGTHDELDENFFLNLSNASAASIADEQGVGTILDNDPPPIVEIDDVVVIEEVDGELRFSINKGGQSGLTGTVDYTTIAGSATSPADFTAVSGTVTISGPDSGGHVNVPIADDALDEGDETFTVVLSNPQNLTIVDDTGVGTISDDDPEPTLSVDDVTVTEGNSGTVNATFTATLSAASGRAVSVNYATANDSAAAPGDFLAAGGTLDFAAGETTKTASVTVIGDLLDEANETFFLNLSGASNATIADGPGVGTITDDDAEPTLSVNDVTVTEGNAGTVDATFTVTLSTASGRDVSVDYATQDDTARSSASGSPPPEVDYAPASGTLAFLAGQTSRTVTVTVNGGEVDELDETFFLNLSNPIAATIADGQGVGTILDDDPPSTLEIDDVVTMDEVDENAGFTVSRSGHSELPVTVTYTTSDGTANAPGDYTAVTGTVTIAGGDGTGHFDVPISDDLLDEDDESFTVTLSNPINGTIVDGIGLGTITDDDAEPSLSVNDVTVTEGNVGHGERDLHSHALRSQRARGVGQLRDRQQLGGGARRLRRDERHARLRSGRDDEDRHRQRERRPARRGERDLLPQPERRVERNARRRPGHRHDHRRRRRAGSSRSGTRRSPRGTPEPSTPPSL